MESYERTKYRADFKVDMASSGLNTALFVWPADDHRTRPNAVALGVSVQGRCRILGWRAGVTLPSRIFRGELECERDAFWCKESMVSFQGSLQHLRAP